MAKIQDVNISLFLSPFLFAETILIPAVTSNTHLFTSLTALTKCRQSSPTYHPLHTPLTKQANQTPIHTLVIFAIHGQTGKVATS